MKLKFLFPSVIACFLALATVRIGLVQAQTASPPKHDNAAPPAPRSLIPPGSGPFLILQSSDAEQRENASIFLGQKYGDEEDKLQAIAGTFLQQSARRRASNPNDPQNGMGNEDDRAAETPIGLLGEFRSTRSVPFLVDHLVSLHIFHMHPVGLGGAYPCAGALVSIGSPSLDPLLVKVTQTDDPLTSYLAAYVFVKVLGNSVGAFFIEDRRTKLTDPVAKRRLEKLAHVVRTEKFPY